MKELRILFVLSTILLMDQAGCQPYSYSSVGDVQIQNFNNGSLYCDSLVCPRGTVSCKVTKKNDPNNFKVIIRHRRCFDWNGAVLAEQIINEPNTYNSNVNMQVSSGGGFQSIQGGTIRQLTPEEKRALDEQLRLTRQQVQAEVARVNAQVAETLHQIDTDMAQFRDGSFAANLNKQIRESMGNMFNYNYY